ncbi:hypothetical protein [Leifsonia sp. SIMBA_070]|uniref:hypothetical protein n=1 Tax=Leifsonia sp. SIMBA_070 TaxID=3085810 RepID=UPI00397D5A76
MSIAPAADIIHVWTEHGTPIRLVWAGNRYRVVGAEPIRITAVHDVLTRPAEQLVGWSVIARAERNRTDLRIFRLQRHGAGWVLIDLDPA